MNIRQLYYFVDIAHGHTYQEVADKYFITQPALTRSMAALEEEIGVRLLRKDGRRIQTTSQGAIYLKYVDKALEILEQGAQKVQDNDKKEKQTIRIASVYCFTYGFIPSLIDSFKTLHRGVNLKLEMDFSMIVINKILQGKSDIGFITMAPSMSNHEELDYHHIMDIDIVAVYSNSSDLSSVHFAGKDHCSLADLKDLPLISFDDNSATYMITKEMFNAAGFEFEPNISVTDDQSALNMIQHSNSVALLLRNVASNAGSVSYLPIEEAGDNHVPFYMITRKDRASNPLIKQFLEFVSDYSHN